MKYVVLVLFLLLGVVAYMGNKKLNDNFSDLNKRLTVVEKIVLPPEEPVQTEAFDIPVGNSFILGNKNAKYNLTVFSNFQCPYCSKADVQIRKLLEDPELKDNLMIVFKHFPFARHVDARMASKACLAAGEQGHDKFWLMSEKCFANQSGLNAANFEKWAKEIGLDVDKFKAHLIANDKKYEEEINNDINLGTQKAQLTGTPWLLINGWMYEENISADNVKKFIKEKKL